MLWTVFRWCGQFKLAFSWSNLQATAALFHSSLSLSGAEWFCPWCGASQLLKQQPEHRKARPVLFGLLFLVPGKQGFAAVHAMLPCQFQVAELPSKFPSSPYCRQFSLQLARQGSKKTTSNRALRQSLLRREQSFLSKKRLQWIKRAWFQQDASWLTRSRFQMDQMYLQSRIAHQVTDLDLFLPVCVKAQVCKVQAISTLCHQLTYQGW